MVQGIYNLIIYLFVLPMIEIGQESSIVFGNIVLRLVLI